MPREREFSEEAVINTAADLFSANGFAGTSVAMLTEATGLGKQSLYNAFGDKHALYLEAVECATARYHALGRQMQEAASGRAALTRFCEHMVEQCTSGNPSENSCIVSAGLLEGIDDPAIHTTLCSKWQASHELVRATIERGQRDGSIRNQTPSAALADLIMSLTSGLRVAARADAAPTRLRSVMQLAQSVVDHAEVV
jgi:TetR/AcrR family transcriptional regulator, transcriptional repressor for nem operon